MKYKSCRNELRHILLKQEKNYYAEWLQANRSNMKKTWSILQSLVNKRIKKQIQAKFKMNDGSITNDKILIKFYWIFHRYRPFSGQKDTFSGNFSIVLYGWSSTSKYIFGPVHHSEIDTIMKKLWKTQHRVMTGLHYTFYNCHCPPLKSLLLIYRACHYRRVYFLMSLRSVMLSLYSKLMIQCSSIITDLFLYCVFCQKSSKNWCIHGWCLFWRPRKLFTIIDLDSVNTTPPIWPSWFS